MWLKNKDQYRKKYYLNEKPFFTVETLYGKKIGELMESPEEIAKHPVLMNVPRYPESEFSIKIEVEGIPIMGYIDSYDPDTHSFYEYKTSRTNMWTPVTVAKHLQLPFYSFLIEQSSGKVNRECHLIWLETAFLEKSIMFDGNELISDSRELELTGKIVSFPRKIYKWERKLIKETIIRVAGEIHNDYNNFLKK